MQRNSSSPASLASFGPAVVTIAAMLWGTDALWRTDLLKTLPAPGRGSSPSHTGSGRG